MNKENHIVLFDGVCNLCESSVQFILKHDKKKLFRFASLQSDYSRDLLTRFHKDPSQLTSVVLVHNGEVYTKSTAVLKVLKILGFPWSVLSVFLVVPARLRNFIYDFVAARRYQWFGRKNECWLPTPELKERFLDG